MSDGKSCEICDEIVPHGHLARHKTRKHPEARPSALKIPTPIELYKRVGEVLDACKIQPEQLDWDNDALNSLPNLRHSQPRPHRHHTPWRVIRDRELSALPSLESLLIEVICRARSEGMEDEAEVFKGNERIKFTSDEWVTWARIILEGRLMSTRVLNMPMGNMISGPESHNYRRRAEMIARQIHQPEDADDLQQHDANANITPRLTKTEAHHDSFPHLSTAIGPAAHGDRPLKLWLLWPSTELHRLARCYNDTNAALSRMDHGCFLVQMPGETIIVPPNAPHAVAALDSCYLYGHTFNINSLAYDPSTIHVDMAGNMSAEEACESRLQQLQYGLRNKGFRQAYIDQFMETWMAEAPVVREPSLRGILRRLVKLWADDMRRNESCVWCVHAGWPGDLYLKTHSFKHAKAHLEGKLPTMDERGEETG